MWRQSVIGVWCSVILMGCATAKEVVITTKPVERQPLRLMDPPPLNLDDLKWLLVTKENFEQVMKELEGMKIDVVLFSLTDEGYEILARNTAMLYAYIRMQQDIIKAYRDYYEPSTF